MKLSHEQRSEINRKNAAIGEAKRIVEGAPSNIARYNAMQVITKINCEDCGIEVETKAWNRKVCKACAEERHRKQLRENYVKRQQ